MKEVEEEDEEEEDEGHRTVELLEVGSGTKQKAYLEPAQAQPVLFRRRCSAKRYRHIALHLAPDSAEPLGGSAKGAAGRCSGVVSGRHSTACAKVFECVPEVGLRVVGHGKGFPG